MNDAREGEKDPFEYDFYFLSLGRKESAYQLTISARDPFSHIPEYRVMCATFAQSRSAFGRADARCSVAYATANDSLTGVVLRKTFLVIRESL